MNSLPANAPFHLYLYGPNQGPIDSSFEQAESRLTDLQRLHFEPDGSFVWSIDDRQQIFGMIYDAAGKIQYCELRGQCDLQSWRDLCFAITGIPVKAGEVLKLPEQRVQDLQNFENTMWSSTDRKQNL